MADQIQLTELIARELKDPRVRHGDDSGRGSHARLCARQVFFSLLVGDPVETAEGLNQAAGFLRAGLFKRLHIHTVPTLHFILTRRQSARRT